MVARQQPTANVRHQATAPLVPRIELHPRSSPQDTDAKIAKMKDGRTHLAHKAEHGVDLETGAILSVTVQDASEGDSATLPETLTMAAEQVASSESHTSTS